MTMQDHDSDGKTLDPVPDPSKFGAQCPCTDIMTMKPTLIRYGKSF
jgi:hypothetical protein